MLYDLIAIDTETGGLDPTRHALLSIAAVPSWDYEPFSVFIQPEGEVDPQAAAVNGYSPEEWRQRGAVPLKTAMVAFLHWLEASGARARKAQPLAHNSAFDQAFLKEAERTTGHDLRLSRRWRCSMAALLLAQDAARCAGLRASLNDLGDAAGFWAKERRGSHEALQDARCCLHGYEFLIDLLQKREGAA
jgi:DNA polymerase III epsilon subunit-like protein